MACLPTHARYPTPHQHTPLPHWQVFELEAGVDSATLWREVLLLRQCRHPRIVPLLGVALEVRLGGGCLPVYGSPRRARCHSLHLA